MTDIEDIEDIKILVDDFYLKVKNDQLLSPVFATRIQGKDWEKHLNRMYDFWNTVLFFQRGYKGNPFSKHLGFPITEVHFSKWVELFTETVDHHFSGEKADETKKRANNMALMFQSKIAYFASKPNAKPLM